MVFVTLLSLNSHSGFPHQQQDKVIILAYLNMKLPSGVGGLGVHMSAKNVSSLEGNSAGLPLDCQICLCFFQF